MSESSGTGPPLAQSCALRPIHCLTRTETAFADNATAISAQGPHDQRAPRRQLDARRIGLDFIFITEPTNARTEDPTRRQCELLPADGWPP